MCLCHGKVTAVYGRGVAYRPYSLTELCLQLTAGSKASKRSLELSTEPYTAKREGFLDGFKRVSGCPHAGENPKLGFIGNPQ